MGKTDAILDIIEERHRQDEKWGGADNDDRRLTSDWIDYMNNQWYYYDIEGRISAREMFVRIGALAVAALESLDRLDDNG